MTALDIALGYIHRGWNPVPVPHRTKKPLDDEWQKRRIDETSAPRFFNGSAQNIGVVLGPMSGGLTDVDLDCAEALALAPYLLPKTAAIFGRKSNPNSHCLYRTTLADTLGKAVLRFRDPTTRITLVELRVGGDKGAQTVFPGSMHETGEPIEWEKSGEPPLVDGAKLQRQVTAIAAGSLLVRYWPENGGRHDAALVVGGVLGRAGWSVAEARQMVGAVAQAAGCADVKAKQDAAESAVNGLAEGANIYGFPALVEFFGEPVAKRVAEWVGFRPNATGPEEALDEAVNLDGEAVTHDGLARVFANRFAGKLRYCHHAGGWYEWTGTHWKRDERERAFQFVRELGRELSEGEKATVVKEVRKVQFAAGTEKLARGDQALAVTSDAWDRDPFLLGTPGGTVDLRTGKLRPADPAEGITRVASIAPAEPAECPLWLSFLSQTFGGDADTIRLMQQWSGYSLTGDVSEHALVFGSGSGGNGKSVFVNTVSGIMGDYATTAAMDTFTASKGDRHPTELAALRGARLVTASETEEGRAWAEAKIKQLTGGDRIAARFMRQDFFEFRPQFKLLIVGNHQPELRTVDEAMRRRVNIVPFSRKPANPDRQLEEKLKAEWPGILRWMVEGCLDWQKNGLVRPQSVKEATTRYFDEQDLFGHWLEEDCDIDHEGKYEWLSSSSGMFEKWVAYAKAAGESPGNTKTFASSMRCHGLRSEHKKTGTVWHSVQLKPSYRQARDGDSSGDR